MENQFVAIGPDDPFTFSCGPHVPCFNECCRDLNQFLTPYDIIRLKSHLGLTHREFLERYAVQHTGPETGLPVVRLRQAPGDSLKCPFVTPEGCGVYENRPSSCRIYPLARAISRNRETGVVTEHFMLLREPHCRGFEQGERQTVGQWMQDQGLNLYNQANDPLVEIISAKNRLLPGPLDFKSARLFHMACYDLDDFRKNIFDKGELESFDFDQDLLDLARTGNDVALLKTSLAWLKRMLFGKMDGTV